jgi:hypothetical protein
LSLFQLRIAVKDENTMALFDSEIIKELCGLSLAMSVAGFGVGLMLWLTGWRAHRFWIVMVTTALAGIMGLISGPMHGIQPLLAGLLLAVAAGVLALTLVQVAAFSAGGAAACLAVRALAPSAWNEPMICFLIGGLAGVILFRFWTMVLTSFAGAIIMGYFGLALGNHFGKVDAVAWSQQKASLLAWGCGLLTVVGFVVQLFMERRRARRQAKEKEQKKPKAVEKKPWWNPAHYRLAG